MLAIATPACVLIAFSGGFGRVTGAAFILLLAAYVCFIYIKERAQKDPQAKLHAEEPALYDARPQVIWLSALLAGGGIVILIIGADQMVSGSIQVAQAIGVSETVIGLTIVAVGTSLPELATSIVAAFRKQTDIALGNIIGSNIFNALGIVGVTAAVSPLVIPANTLTYDLWALLVATALLLFFAFTDSRISRREGAIFLTLYGAYMILLSARALNAA